jgi:hypothetical protein
MTTVAVPHGTPTLIQQHGKTIKDGDIRAAPQIQHRRKMQDGRKRDRRKMEDGEQKRKLRPPQR